MAAAMHNQVQLALRQFVQTFPLNQPAIIDRQPHPSNPGPSEIHGTVVLPLWQGNATINATSPQWNTYLQLLQSLTPILSRSAIILSSVDKNSYDGARRLYLVQVITQDPANAIPPPHMTDWNCFESMRISANLACDAAPLGPGTGSGWRRAQLAFAGQAQLVVNLHQPDAGSVMPCTRSSLLYVPPGIKIGTAPYVGEWYQLEFFLPVMGEERRRGCSQ